MIGVCCQLHVDHSSSVEAITHQFHVITGPVDKVWTRNQSHSFSPQNFTQETIHIKGSSEIYSQWDINKSKDIIPIFPT